MNQNQPKAQVTSRPTRNLTFTVIRNTIDVSKFNRAIRDIPLVHDSLDVADSLLYSGDRRVKKEAGMRKARIKLEDVSYKGHTIST